MGVNCHVAAAAALCSVRTAEGGANREKETEATQEPLCCYQRGSGEEPPRTAAWARQAISAEAIGGRQLQKQTQPEVKAARTDRDKQCHSRKPGVPRARKRTESKAAHLWEAEPLGHRES